MKRQPKWTIGIVSLTDRHKLLDRLLAVLAPQKTDAVEIRIIRNTGQQPIGVYRQMILDAAQGEYISFIDDDDLVPADFISTILPLLDGVDYIGFKVCFIDDGVQKKPAIHSLEHSDWCEDDVAFYRGVTHLNPVRTELARQSFFSNKSMGEDYDWAVKVPAKTEHFIDRYMYTYLHQTKEREPQHAHN